MLSVNDAFRKFKSRLELNTKEQDNATCRQKEVREFLDTKFEIDNSFLTGSYARWTKTKPLKDIDIFFVLGDGEDHYRGDPPTVVLSDFEEALREKYGNDASQQNRSINVNFGVKPDSDDNTDYRILSVDVVPAFACGDDYEIPDKQTNGWIKTNPKTHAQLATDAHQAYSNEWKGMVRMVKYWNNNPAHLDKPIRPSFLIEVMALRCLHGGWGGSFDRELQALFATLADCILETWPDPAGLGPPISDGMDHAKKIRAQTFLRAAERQASVAIDHARRGRNGEALKTWRSLFGPKFPLS